MKKILALALAAAMSLTLVACGGSKTPAASGSASSGGSSSAETVDFPGNKQVSLIVPYSAGGASDTVARIYASELEQSLGTSIVVSNVTGASGWVMWNQMMENTDPDGYSFFLINSPNVTTGKYDPDNTMKYDQNDFEMICNEVTDSNCLAIRVDDDRYSDWDSFAAYWKQAGSLITSASGLGITSDDATADMLVANDLGVDVDIIASGGSGDNVTFLLNGTTDFLMGNVSEMVAAHNDGQFKILCVFAEERDSNLPDVPTYEELTGNLVVGCSSRGYAMLKDVPDDIKQILGDAVKAAVQDPDLIEQLNAIYTTTDYKEGQEYVDYMNQQQQQARETWGV